MKKLASGLRQSKTLLAVTLIETLVVACTHTVTIRSEPIGATVFQTDAQGNRGAPVGNTPVTFTPDRSRKYLAVEVKKDGFESKSVVVPVIEATNVDLGVKLKPIDETWLRERLQKEQSRVLSAQFLQLLKLQNAILQGAKEEVKRLEESMKPQFSEISAWHSMLGNHYFLIGNRERALAYYKQAYELDPGNPEARTMMSTLNKGK